jgi:hypothetical protein
MRFGLTTFSLARRRSTAELRPHVYAIVLLVLQLIYNLGCDSASGPGRIRTDDLLLAKETPSR